ncbi:granulocyte-macrophage colony-stimulating factor receptor subunit alpha isoform X2 [Xenopus laevis]|uniref:Granulocyte-macrophage colony-stimulating factor receptor subunit alpha isoform X2 n=1 Tax=Xenopus laevis TaxID=8355 RepID=A0A8J0ULQ5_XENLA|nr:granulocyte-macrophage colony-stimulating factor receptor subunit alpha isoform X2 [Xenopus laevis]
MIRLLFAMAWTLLTFCKLFILGTLQYIRASSAEENSPLQVEIKNVTVKASSLSIAWNCNITEEMKKKNYYAQLKNKESRSFPMSLNIQNCSTEFFIHDLKGLTLHEGVYVKITANNKEAENTTWTAFYPEGENQTSAENVSCILYVSLVNCSWDFGKKAPNDTVYSLWLYQDKQTGVECQDYKTNLSTRQMQCSFKAPDIESKSRSYLLVEGSSNTTSILFYGQWIFLAIKEILNPPRNIQVNVSTHGVQMKWQNPETLENDPAECFSYQISLKEDKMQGKNYSVHQDLHYTSNEFSSSQHFELKMRAIRDKICCLTEWSTWSEPFKFDPPAISTVIAVTGLIYVCHRFQVLTKVFPPVPTPVIKLQSLEQDELKELQEKLHSGSEKQPDNEENIKICEIDNS